MFPYWVLFSIFALGSFGSEPGGRRASNLVVLLFACFLMFLMLGLRWQVGGDWDTYDRIFVFLSRGDFSSALTATEPAYGAVNWLSAKLGTDIWGVNLVCAGFFVFGLQAFARLQPNPALTIVVAVPTLVIVVAMGYTRQGAAVGMGMLALVALHEGKIAKTLLLVVLASTFHRSALLMLPLCGMSFSKNRFQAITLLVIASAGAYFYLLESAIDKYSSSYVDQGYEAQGAGVRLAMNLLPALLTAIYAKRLGFDETEKRLWLIFAALAVILNVLFLFLESNVALDRLGIYVIPLQMMIYSRLPTLLSRGDSPDQLITLGVVSYSAIVLFVWLVYAANSDSWKPYLFLPLV